MGDRMVCQNDTIQINLILKKDVKDKFEEIKNITGVAEPNTKTIEKCITATHKQLLG